MRLATFLSGDLSLRATIAIACAICVCLAVTGWFIISFTIGLSDIRIRLFLSHIHLLLLGFSLIYSASLISQAARNSYSGITAKIIGFITSLLMMIAGMVVIIFVSSGELSWMIYLDEGLNLET